MSKEETEKAKEDLIYIKGTLEKMKDIIFETEEVYICVNDILDVIDQLEQENNKQFKIIDEMAAYIAGLDIDEDICKKVEKSLCNGKTSVPVSSCIECIRQYFEKKVEEE